MTRILEFQTRQSQIRALRIILGETTRPQILSLCPRASVGVKMNGVTPDDRDIRWVVLPGGGDLTEDGEWLVCHAGDRFEFLSDTEFHSRYEAAE